MNEHVLIVDDSLTVRMDLAEAFQEAGFRTSPCASAAEAREAWTRTPPAVCVLDVRLPDGDGVSLLQEIRGSAAGATAIVVMLSSETEVKDRVRGLQTGADEYVGKPYDRHYLVARVQELLRRQHGATERTTILVIDDSVTFREELRTALQRAGYAVVTASTGEDGLRMAAASRPDAVVVDGELPGIDGSGVIRTLRLDAVLRDVPCLLLTASEDQSAELRAFEAGADTFARKETDLDVTIARLEAILRQTAARQQAGEAVSSVLGPKKILAVDDSQTYLHELTDALKGEGYDIILARSGEEALALLAVQPVDCILLDRVMSGLGGEETCQRIKTAPVVREIPLIMLTGFDSREAMVSGLAAGADDYVSKSSEFDVIRARVRAQIRRKQFEDEHRRTREELLHKELEAAEAQAAQRLAEARAVLIEELENKNAELEAFSYSVSHDLRAPLRSIDGFSKLVLDDTADTLDPKAKQYLGYVRASAQRMGQIIDDLLELSRVARADLQRAATDLSGIARDVLAELQRRDPDRQVVIEIQDGMQADADPRLLRIVCENLLSNAWKFTAKGAAPAIAVGVAQTSHGQAYFVRDNGAGFDMAYAEKLFRPFQRLHGNTDFPGTGIGLATVHRVIDRHGGRIWAEAALDRGASFYFTLPPPRR